VIGGIALEELENFVANRTEHYLGSLLQIRLIVFALALEIFLEGLKSFSLLLIDSRVEISTACLQLII